MLVRANGTEFKLRYFDGQVELAEVTDVDDRAVGLRVEFCGEFVVGRDRKRQCKLLRAGVRHRKIQKWRVIALIQLTVLSRQF